MVAAVVFDMDGVIVDSEQVWDEVREELVADWGGRSRPEAQRAMMGMSSPEWSRYMHDELGLAAEPPEEINARGRRRMLERYHGELPLLDGAVEAVALAGGVVSARRRVVLEPAADRRRARDGRASRTASWRRCRRRRCRAGSPARTSIWRRRGGSASRAARVCGGRGLGERDPCGEGGRDGRDRVSRTGTTRPMRRRLGWRMS